ncbi:MAG TPA: hypothetical protein VER58_05695 [Thermoanaerobaculia bacterium]|nr:hypothetical protein [Thermoanaerobaculia bacterium]
MVKKPDSPSENDDAEVEMDAAFGHARSVIERLTGEKLPKAKNPAAVALGALGASKGGKARAAKLHAKRRSEIARKAAKKRWGGPK